MSFLGKLFGKKENESLNQGLEKTKQGFLERISKAIIGKTSVDDEVLDQLEEALIGADVGVILGVCIEITLKGCRVAKAHAGGAQFEVITEDFEAEGGGAISKRGQGLGGAEGEQGLVGHGTGTIERGDGGSCGWVRWSRGRGCHRR